MPYVKDTIGKSPRYVFATTSRQFDHAKCANVAWAMKTVGIPYSRQHVRDKCWLTFRDSYEAHVDDLARRKRSYFSYMWISY